MCLWYRALKFPPEDIILESTSIPCTIALALATVIMTGVRQNIDLRPCGIGNKSPQSTQQRAGAGSSYTVFYH
jgi:hypothetical protein